MAESPLRLFVAVELPEPVRAALGGSIEQLRSHLRGPFRWVEPRSIHLTLKFLGDVGADRVAHVTSALEAAVGGTPPFELRLEGTGVFPTGRAPNVVWAGIAGDVASLVALAAAVESAIAGAGEPPETRAYRPHLTLGRVRGRLGGPGVDELTRCLSEVTYEGTAPFRVEAVSLMRSELTPGGARHTRMALAPLRGSWATA